MPDIRDVYTEIESWELPQLHQRREAIVSSAPRIEGTNEPNYDALADEPLSELLAIQRAMRKKIASNSGGTRRASSPGTRKPSSKVKAAGDLL